MRCPAVRLVAPMVLVALTCVSNASAAVIGPGFDLLHTPPGGAFLDLGLGAGIVQLQGNPTGPGNTDTIVQRMDPGPPDGMGFIHIDTEIVALSLTSIDPVTLGGSSFDVSVTLDPSTRSLGEIEIRSHDDRAGGGTFDSFFNVFVEFTFREVGNPLNTWSARANDQLQSTNTPWSHTPVPGYVETLQYPAGGFYITAAGIHHTGPHPKVVPATPEPSTLLVWSVLGTLGLAVGWSRPKRSA